MHSKNLFIGLMVAVVMGVSTAVAAADIAWDKIIGIDLKKLTPEHKKQTAQHLNKFANTRGCSGSIAQCMAQGDMTARRHAGYVARMVRKGKSGDFIKAGIDLRHKSAFPSETFNIDLSDHPVVGGKNPKVVVVEYACFQCPFCAHVAPQLKNLKTRFGDKVAHYFKLFPVRSHNRGVASALAGVAAYRQGKFWEMAEIMFAKRTNLDDPDLLKYAKKVGLDIAKFQADIKDRGAMRYIEKDKLEGMRFGVEGTPTFFVNGKAYLGTQDYTEIADRIAEELDIVEGRIK
ncbi:MAG: thioredoxin domain-containing protein [Myxococcota bacterium]|nr:thioredoxin domain-containing protein [Myxococcota bacterium]